MTAASILFALFAPAVSAADVTFVLKADIGGWNSGQPGGANPTLTVNPGDSVTVTIEFVDINHNWALYPGGTLPSQVSLGSSNALVRAPDVTPSTPVSSIVFAAPDSGTYEYYCEYHPTMHGKFVVTGNAAPRVIVDSPTSGLSWTGGTDHAVIVRITDDEPTSNLTVWVNFTHSGGGGAIAMLAPPGPNPNVIPWTVPQIDATSVEVNVTARDGRGRFTYQRSATFEIDSTLPMVDSRNPLPNAVGVSINAQVVVVWSEAMNQTASGSLASLGLLDLISSTWVPRSVSWSPDSSTMTVDPTLPLEPMTTYRVFVNGTAKDDSNPGNAFLPAIVWDFVTGPTVDVTGPAITSVDASPPTQTPSGSVNITARIMDPSGLTSVTVHIVGPSLEENLTMARIDGNLWYVMRSFSAVGTYSFTIWAVDTAGNAASNTGSFTIELVAESPVTALTNLLWIVVPAAFVAGIGLLFWLRRRRATKRS